MRVQEAPLLPSPPQGDAFAVALRVALSKYIREHALEINALADEVAGLSGGVSDGDKGDVVVTVGGTVWSLDAAIAAKLVTNGDTHDHNGGDGGTIAATSISGFDTQVRTSRLDQMALPTASVNFNGQQATSLRIENLTSDPGSPTTGQIWLRTDL